MHLLSENYNVNTSLESLLKDHFVWRVWDEALEKRFFAMHNLTFAMAQKEALVYAASPLHCRGIWASSAKLMSAETYQVYSGDKSPRKPPLLLRNIIYSSQRNCYCCGRNYTCTISISTATITRAMVTLNTSSEVQDIWDEGEQGEGTSSYH